MAGKKRIMTFMLIALVSLFFVGCSDDSNPVATPTDSTVDTAPPAPPVNLMGTLLAVNRTVNLSWDLNTVDSDLAGYVIFRDNGDLRTILVDEPINVNEYQDAYPQPGQNTYNVYSVDDSGNESAISSVIIELAAPRAINEPVDSAQPLRHYNGPVPNRWVFPTAPHPGWGAVPVQQLQKNTTRP